MAPFGQISLAAIFAFILLTSTQAAVVPGHVEAWGNNVFGQATPPAGLDGVIAIAAGSEHSLALRTNGTVIAWGDNSQGQCNVPAGLSDAIAIAAGLHSVALRSNGTVVVWGSTNLQVTTIPPGLGSVIAVAARGSVGSRESYTLALKQDGTVVAWGAVNSEQTTVPAGLAGVANISAGYQHAIALKTDGTILGWGASFFGITSHPSGLTDVVAVEAGQYCNIAVKSDGSTFFWGEPSIAVNTQLPAGLVSVNSLHLGLTLAVALRFDGSVASWGLINNGTAVENAQVPNGINGVSTVAVGDNHALYLTARPLVSAVTSPVKATVGSPVTLSVTASGLDLHFQWKKNGVDLAGRTEASLTIQSVQPSDAGTYAVHVSNPHGYFDSPSTSIFFDPPLIQNAPTNLTIYRGETARFTVRAQGLEPLTYEWRKGIQLIPGEEGSVLSIPNVRKSDEGFYQVTVRDVAGGIVKALATLTVIDPTVGTKGLSISRKAAVSLGVNPQGTATILAGTRNNGTVDRAIIAFDLSSLPQGATIQSASLRMNVTKVPRGYVNSTFSLYRMLTPWGAGVSWFNAQTGIPWAAPGGQLGTDFAFNASASAAVSGIANYDFASAQLAADVQAWLNNPASNQGWMLKSGSEQLGRTARHFGTAPQLTVSYSTSPSPVTIENSRRENGEMVFDMVGAPGWIYRVETKTNVAEGNWAAVTNAPAGAGTNRIVIRAPMNEAQQFYRVTAE